MTQTNISPRARALARRSALQALYQWFLTGQPMSEIISEFEQERKELQRADGEYFRELLSGVSAHTGELGEALAPCMDRPLHELDPVTRAVLHLGMYELKYQQLLPLRIVLNEAIELARMFGPEESWKYVNGVLDRAAQQWRPEAAADGSARTRADRESG